MEKTIFLFCLFFSAKILAFDFAGLQERLETEKIVAQIPMEEFLESKGHKVYFTTPVFLVELESGLKAVLKISDPDWPRDAIAEAAAFRASCFFHIPLVPPTVLYAKEGVVGSLQAYVEPSYDLMADGNYEKALAKASLEDLANIALFYFVMGQWDPDPSNLIAVENEEKVQFALIDNAAIGFSQKARYGEHPFVLIFPEREFPSDGLEIFPFDNVRVFSPRVEVLEQEFKNLLDPKEMQRLCSLRAPIYLNVWRGKLWRQYRFGNPSYTDYYPEGTIAKLKNLTLDDVKGFFLNSLDFTWEEDFFMDILERRDQVLKAFEKG